MVVRLALGGSAEVSSSSILILELASKGEVGGFGSLHWTVARRVVSSNRGKTTMLGSPETLAASMGDSLLKLLASEAANEPRRNGDNRKLFMSGSSLYSGMCWKLSGLTTTLYVPGLIRSAFRSRSSSVVRFANGGRSSANAEVVLSL